MKFTLLLSFLTFIAFSQLSAQTATAGTGSSTTSASVNADSTLCKEQLSLYREYYKIKLYSHALPHWRWMFMNCPKATQNIYIDGVKIISDYIGRTTDPALKEKIIDTLLMVYDQRIQYYGREGYVLGRKAIDALEYRPAMIEQVYPWLQRSVELQENKSDGAVLVYYLNTAIQLATSGKIDKAEIFTVYDKAMTIADHNANASAEDPKNFDTWNKVKINLESIIEPHASCSDLVNIYGKKFKETPNDPAFLRSMLNILDKRNCTNEGDLFFRATEALHKIEPNAQSAYLMGKLSIQNNQLSKAAEYMSQAAEMSTDTTEKVKALFALANIYAGNKNYAASRSTAYKIIHINPHDGKAYLLIGDLYAMSAGMCDTDDLGGKTVFWAAIDKYLKAKSVDNSVESQANEKIAQYSRYYPASTDLFFRDMQEGSSFTVGCWINETTTVRGSK
jgi:tetratricopeptide (TPR) repeat protein